MRAVNDPELAERRGLGAAEKQSAVTLYSHIFAIEHYRRRLAQQSGLAQRQG
jgi:hypothetical protein